ncbi:MAG TPA: hypothetical protein VMG12_01000 [Polyangiaceae bacterium]|nr:hypothetical protein [Polyangiaceae bacterium]
MGDGSRKNQPILARSGARRWTAVALFGATTACGGLASDGPSSGGPTPDDGVGASDSEFFPGPASPLASAVASVLLGVAVDCPYSVAYLVPSSDAVSTLESGDGERAIDGRDGNIECRVARLAGARRSYAVDLEYRESGSGGQISLSGELARGLDDPVHVIFEYYRGRRLEADCRAHVRQVQSGAIWLSADDCTSVSYAGSPVECDLELATIFENCEQ